MPQPVLHRLLAEVERRSERPLTRLIGRHEGESAHGDRRAFLVWDRLILPNGKSLILSEEPGVDAQGAVGVRGEVDRRLLPLGVATLFAGAITTLGELARGGSEYRSFAASAGSAASIEASQVGGRLVDRELGVQPSIRVRAGAPVRVMITRDLILELAACCSIPVRQRPLRVDELSKCQEMFLTSTSAEILPIVMVDEDRVGTGKPGPVTKSIQAAFARHLSDWLVSDESSDSALI